ncbi:hypothetical protein MMC10_005379 [Thelotrema lepadinum]|nr:hypothetical protein [Thelotrema lepadinum]
MEGGEAAMSSVAAAAAAAERCLHSVRARIAELNERAELIDIGSKDGSETPSDESFSPLPSTPVEKGFSLEQCEVFSAIYGQNNVAPGALPVIFQNPNIHDSVPASNIPQGHNGLSDFSGPSNQYHHRNSFGEGREHAATPCPQIHRGSNASSTYPTPQLVDSIGHFGACIFGNRSSSHGGNPDRPSYAQVVAGNTPRQSMTSSEVSGSFPSFYGSTGKPTNSSFTSLTTPDPRVSFDSNASSFNHGLDSFYFGRNGNNISTDALVFTDPAQDVYDKPTLRAPVFDPWPGYGTNVIRIGNKTEDTKLGSEFGVRIDRDDDLSATIVSTHNEKDYASLGDKFGVRIDFDDDFSAAIVNTEPGVAIDHENKKEGVPDGPNPFAHRPPHIPQYAHCSCCHEVLWDMDQMIALHCCKTGVHISCYCLGLDLNRGVFHCPICGKDPEISYGAQNIIEANAEREAKRALQKAKALAKKDIYDYLGMELGKDGHMHVTRK